MAQGAQRAQLPVRDQPNYLDWVDLASMFNPTDLLYQNFSPRYERHPHMHLHTGSAPRSWFWVVSIDLNGPHHRQAVARSPFR